MTVGDYRRLAQAGSGWLKLRLNSPKFLKALLGHGDCIIFSLVLKKQSQQFQLELLFDGPWFEFNNLICKFSNSMKALCYFNVFL